MSILELFFFFLDSVGPFCLLPLVCISRIHLPPQSNTSFQIDASTQSLLDRVVAFDEIVPLRETLGLNLSLSQKATVADWYIAYTAAAKLRETQKTFSTLTGSNLSADVEKALHAASVEHVRQTLIADARKFVASKLDTIAAPIKTLIGSELNARAFSKDTISAIQDATRIIDDAASIVVARSTVREIVSLLVDAREELRAIADSLRTEANARQQESDSTTSTDAWATIYSASADKSTVESAIKSVQGVKHDAVIEWDSIIKAQLPSEHKAISAALEKFSQVASSIPKDLLDAEIARRAALFA